MGVKKDEWKSQMASMLATVQSAKVGTLLLTFAISLRADNSFLVGAHQPH